MFSGKLRSWMEAVRSRKKQHRKDKQTTKTNLNTTNNYILNWQKDCRSLQDDTPNEKTTKTNLNQQSEQPPPPTNSSLYSATNLSSPESAYSTGYSTDGTSPGAPPEHYINIKTGTKYFHNDADKGNNDNLTYLQNRINGEVDIKSRTQQLSPICQSTRVPSVLVHQNHKKTSPMTQELERMERISAIQQHVTISTSTTTTTTAAAATVTTGSGVYPGISTQKVETIASPILTSPRQRNRIRTNPWLPSGRAQSPGQIRQELTKITTVHSLHESPNCRRYLSPSSIRTPIIKNRSLSSSSCSSLSGTSLHWGSRRNIGSGSDEDDCTLNEMMGRYDESYIYEKETDILSDSDPTDCDTDIDTGQDGGDEDDQLDGEFDFIDNGSYLDVDTKEERNTGHCIYYNFDIQKRSFRRRMTRRSKQNNDKKRKSTTNKKRHKHIDKTFNYQNGTRSAGATPLSVRRTKQHPISKLALDDTLKKRSNSICFIKDYSITTIDKRDKEADKKYKELIVEAEQILRNMKTNNLSPRRLPGPANKRVEILRNAECNKPDVFMKNRVIDDLQSQQQQQQQPQVQQTTQQPSNNCARFSPKKNHITNFMMNNSETIWKDNELPPSPRIISSRKSELIKNHNRFSPKSRKKIIKTKQPDGTSSSDSENEKYKNNNSYSNCPQSEPVRRKVYNGKTVAFNINYDVTTYNNSPPYSPTRHNIQKYKNSSENLRQQVLLNTIANLKRSLEDQSASLKQVYKSSQNIHP